jgi:hypothetical protein
MAAAIALPFKLHDIDPKKVKRVLWIYLSRLLCLLIGILRAQFGRFIQGN